MNKHLSVLALYARNNFLRLLSLMAAMGILEAVLYVLHWNRVDREQPPLPAAEDLLRGIPLMSMAALLLLLFLLCRSGGEAPAIAYTLRRLRIPEETTVLWKAVYNGLCLLLFWAVQAGAAMGLCLWYASVIGPDYSSPQTVFLAFYRSPFFHNLLPLDNWTRYLRNLVLLLSLGFCAAVRTYKLRRGSRYGWGMVTFLWGVVYASFSAGISSCFMDIVVIAVSLIAAAADAAYLRRGWRGELDEAYTH